MSFERREYAGAAPRTTLASGINSSATTIPLVSGTGYPTGSGASFFIVIDAGTANEEKVFCDARSGNNITLASAGDRGADDTTAVSHAAGATVDHCFTATDADEANAHVTDTDRDDHTQYLNDERHDALSHEIGTALPDPGTPNSIGTSNSEGTDVAAARADHTHALGAGVVTGGNGLFLFGGVLCLKVDNLSCQINGNGELEVIPDGAPAVADGSITTSKLASGAVTTVKIGDDQVTAAKIAAGAVGASEIADGSVGTAELADDAVTAAKLGISGAVIGSAMDRLVPSSSNNGTGTDYLNWPTSAGNGPLTVSYTKKLGSSESLLRFRIEGTGYPVTDPGHRYYLAVRVGGTDYEVCRWYSNQAVSNQEHEHHGGVREVTGLAAGAYTVTGRLKTDAVSGTNAWECGTNDTWYLVVEEILI